MTDDAIREIEAVRERIRRLEAAAAGAQPEPPLTFASLKKLDRATINRRWEEVKAVLAAGPTPPQPDAGEDGPWPWRPPVPATPPTPAAAPCRTWLRLCGLPSCCSACCPGSCPAVAPTRWPWR